MTSETRRAPSRAREVCLRNPHVPGGIPPMTSETRRASGVGRNDSRRGEIAQDLTTTLFVLPPPLSPQSSEFANHIRNDGYVVSPRGLEPLTCGLGIRSWLSKEPATTHYLEVSYGYGPAFKNHQNLGLSPSENASLRLRRRRAETRGRKSAGSTPTALDATLFGLSYSICG